MPPLSPNAALAAIEKKKLAPIYWIYGEERFFIDRLVAALKKHALGEGPVDFNFDQLDGAKSPAGEAVGAASSHPVMATRRLVLVKGAQAYKAADLEKLAAYAERPLETSTLAFIAEGKPDLRRKAFKQIERLGGLIECKAVRERDIGPWISRMAEERGVSADRTASEVFLEYIGTDLLALEQTLEKAALLVGEGGKIDGKTARDAVATTRHATVWEVFDAAAEGRLREAVAGLHRLYTDGESVVGIVALFYRQFKRVWLAGELAAKGLGRPQIARELSAAGMHVPDWALEGLARQVGRLPAARCRALAPRFYELDRMAKGGSRFPELHLDRLVFDLAASRR